MNTNKYNSRFVNLRPILGNTWAMFIALLGGRMTGKSYAVMDFILNTTRKNPSVKNYWLRISDTSVKLLLANKARALIDPDLVRKYKLEISTKSGVVYNKKKPLVEVMPLSGMAKSKGMALYDKDFDGWINIVLDEFQLEQGEKRTSFDILYNFINTVETIARTRKNKIRIFLIGNTLQEASEILKAFNFIPEDFGLYKLKRKRCLIYNIAPTEEYYKDRKGSAADLLGAQQMSNYTNQLTQDVELITKKKKVNMIAKIKFGGQLKDQFILWNDNIISQCKGQHAPRDISMTRYLQSVYDQEIVNSMIANWDYRRLKFDSLITLAYFKNCLQKIKK